MRGSKTNNFYRNDESEQAVFFVSIGWFPAKAQEKEGRFAQFLIEDRVVERAGAFAAK